MKAKETAYVDLYRDLAARRDLINEGIASLQQFVDALKEWQTPPRMPLPLQGIHLSPLVSAYYEGWDQLERMWADLARDERVGLESPSTLKQPA
jgi:hypothetical protein